MQLFYRERGQTTHPPLILLHGLWGASDNWLPIARLAGEHFHVFLPDLRNHGNSPHSPIHTYQALSEDIAGFITRLNLPCKPFIAGHSMGGKALMHLLLRKPEIAAKATIIDICPKNYLTGNNDLHSTVLGIIEKIQLPTLKNRKELNIALQQLCPDTNIQQLLLKNIRKTPETFEWKIAPEAIKANLPALAGWPLTNTTYPQEILFLKGGASEYILSDDIARIRQYFPKAILNTIPQASHNLHTDQPYFLTRALIDFFLP